MSVAYAVDLDELDDVIARMTKFQSLLDRQIAHLDTTVADLHLTFTGAAATAQQAAHQEWARGAREMHAGLGEMIGAAKLAHANYLAAVRANQAMWGPLA
ncbi:MAG: WXG100 family type VII secretion target [Nocardioides sp.]